MADNNGELVDVAALQHRVSLEVSTIVYRRATATAG
jgi:hypothetical protein